MKFEELSKKKTVEVENSILDNWKKIDILQKTIDNREGKKDFVFYDGPATANGMPGLHHMLAKFLKDTFCKYKTMQGYRVLRKVGWDTHGLPVELEVEKELGFKSKGDIEKYGIGEFNQKCKESVWRNEKAFSDLTEKMGQFIDLKTPYVTYDNNYIETGWWILKKFFDEGYFYEGYKILPYCPRCGTGLASHEVAQGYKETSVDSVTVTFKKKEEDVYFLVWTTTPWTLISNVGLCVHPREKYVKVESKGYKFILAEALVNSVLGDEYEVLERYTGKDLEYTEFEQLLPFLEAKEKAFFVVCDEYVTMDDGTGIVHMAPAFGQDDYSIGRKYGLPVFNPVGEDGRYTEGPWKDMLIFDADLDIIKWLKENDKLFKKQKIVHNYPHCWRCESPLVYYSKPSYYLEVTKLKDKIVAENKKVNWYPSYVGEKRFENWLENLNDWAISRNRYWGTPIPLWRCDCGHMHMIGSREELVGLAVEKIDQTIDLHRPYVDDIHIKCSKCNAKMKRIPEVIDCWFDSGSMPFAQYHYPFSNKELWENQFPADFICEGIDQTRGWFYTLIVLSVFVTGKSPYKNVLVNDLLLDKHGKKMSKSKGNAINPFELMDSYGADAIRWYLPYVSPIWLPIKFDEEGLKDVYSKFISTLKNTYNFFAIYANTDEIDPRTFNVDYKNRPEIDKWLLSKYNKLVKEVIEYMDEYDLTNTVRSIQEFVGEDLSNWYIRRNRRRFWSSELDDDKKAVYNTTYEVLVGVCKLIAPIVPFISEEIYTKLTGEESVHLADYPASEKKHIDNSIEERMDLIRELISLGRNIREEVRIKVRQPLSEALIDGKNKKLIEDLVPLIEEELNVKKVLFISDLANYMSFTVKPNFKEVGKVFGPKIKIFGEQLLNLSYEEIDSLQNNKTISMDIEGETYEVDGSMVDIRTNSKEGFDVATLDNNFIILNTELTEELLLEGIARELISKVQNLRKTMDFDIVDRINLYYESDETVAKAVTSHKEFIMNETLSLVLTDKKLKNDTIDLNGHDAKISIEKAK